MRGIAISFLFHAGDHTDSTQFTCSIHNYIILVASNVAASMPNDSQPWQYHVHDLVETWDLVLFILWSLFTPSSDASIGINANVCVWFIIHSLSSFPLSSSHCLAAKCKSINRINCSLPLNCSVASSRGGIPRAVGSPRVCYGPTLQWEQGIGIQNQELS